MSLSRRASDKKVDASPKASRSTPLFRLTLMALAVAFVFGSGVGCHDAITENTPETQSSTEAHLPLLLSKKDKVDPPPESTVSYVRFKTRRSSDKRILMIDVEAKAGPKLPPYNTVAFVNVDIFYDVDELTYSWSLRGVLGPGYSGGSSTHRVTDGDLVRVGYFSTGIGYPPPSGVPGHNLRKSWELIERHHFRINGDIRDPSLVIRPRTLDLGFYDSPGNSDLSNTFFYSHVVIR